MNNYYFPFGEKLTKVQQSETTPNKEVFVLGVYASAVHAKWLDKDGKIKVQALAVASEPEIFWRGLDAKEQIEKIKTIPNELGSLEPANKNLNGPSGVALDDLFLKPLGYSRQQAWLCDLLPESRVNPNQQNAVKIYFSFYLKFLQCVVQILVNQLFQYRLISPLQSDQRHRKSKHRYRVAIHYLVASGVVLWLVEILQ